MSHTPIESPVDSAAADSEPDFIGVLKQRLSADQCTASHWHSPASAPDIEPHGHEDPQFVIITSGEFATIADGPDSGATVIFNPAGTYHADRFIGSGTFIGLTLGIELSRSIAELKTPRTPTKLTSAATHGIAFRLKRGLQSKDARFAVVMEELCWELVGCLVRPQVPPSRTPPWLYEVADCLRDEPAMPIHRLAQRIGVHPVHLTRSFRAHYRCTPSEYCQAIRARRAVELLQRSRLSVTEIAFECRYADHSHLVRSLRRHYGASPTELRRALA